MSAGRMNQASTFHRPAPLCSLVGALERVPSPLHLEHPSFSGPSASQARKARAHGDGTDRVHQNKRRVGEGVGAHLQVPVTLTEATKGCERG